MKNSDILYNYLCWENGVLQQQAPNAQMASTTLPDISVPEDSVHEQTVHEQTLPVHIESPTIPENVNEPVFTITSEDYNCGDQ